jgi:hypothetical protein
MKKQAKRYSVRRVKESAGDIATPSLGNGIQGGSVGSGDTFGALSQMPVSKKIVKYKYKKKKK